MSYRIYAWRDSIIVKMILRVYRLHEGIREVPTRGKKVAVVPVGIDCWPEMCGIPRGVEQAGGKLPVRLPPHAVHSEHRHKAKDLCVFS